MRNVINHKPVTAHLFEYTTSFAIDPNLHFKYPDKGIVPTQIIFCMKERNQKKINSHRWFFNAFGSLLQVRCSVRCPQGTGAETCGQPNVCVLIDVGTRPGPKSLYYLWKAFDLDSNVGGACGEIAAYKGKNWSALLNPLGNWRIEFVRWTTNNCSPQSQRRTSSTRSATFSTNPQRVCSAILVFWWVS